MPEQPDHKSFARIPLRIVLIGPLVALVILAIGLVGYLSFRNGQQAVNDVAHQLRAEITARIVEHLQDFLSTPHRINQINASAMRQGWLNAADPQALERHLVDQMKIFEAVTSIYFGNTQGGLVDAGREGAGGAQYVIITDGFAQGPFRKYSIDGQGNHAELLSTVPNFDARTRPWYTRAAEKGRSVWSDMYVLFTGQDMAIAASYPVYDEQQQMLGVVSVDIFASHISSFMRGIQIGKNGQSFIMERSGLLVASSTDEKPFIDPPGDKPPTRLLASQSTVPIIQQTAEFLTAQFGDYGSIADEYQLEFKIEDQRQFLQVTPFQDPYGIDWLIVVVIPEADFMAQIEANYRQTALLVLAALLIALILGILISRWVSQPILRLNASSQALAQGVWQPTAETDWIAETGELSHSFNQMAMQLQRTLESLTAEITERNQAEASLRESEERFRLAFESANIGVCLIDTQGRFMRVNRQMSEMLGYSKEELEGLSIDAITAPEYRGVSAQYYQQALPKAITQLEHEKQYIHKQGQVVWARVSAAAIQNAQGAPLYFIAHVEDITERKQAEELIKNALAEKETLLRELYHRTKNNMQVICSMLSLQSAHVQDEYALKTFREMENRIQSMALVHQKLYQSQNLSSIDLKEYIGELTALLMTSYKTSSDRISLALLDVESTFVPIDIAVPCGLVLNELLSNALKYAFPEGRKGKITISLRRAEDGIITLQISDDGIGVPENFNFRESETLGLQTVLGIVEHQLQGEVSVKTEHGLTWQIQFRDNLYRTRV